MATTVAIIGADGQLGTDLLAAFDDHSDYAVVPLTIDDLNIGDFTGTRAALRASGAQIVINTAAYHRVDDCEEHPDDAFLTNAAAVNNLARVCREMDAALMHFSTDYVFDGAPDRKRPFRETDTPQPQSVYATSKLAGEFVVRSTWEKHYVIRTCGLYGFAGGWGQNASRNFVEIMLDLAEKGQPVRVVDDQRLAPTATMDLAPKLVELLGTGRFGLYHITNAGHCTWFEFAREVFRLAGRDASVTPVSTEAWGAAAKRPAYSVLSNTALRAAGLKPLRSWKKALAGYMAARAGSRPGSVT
jgi:dTDP-4-dehydrorhamnose reductase